MPYTETPRSIRFPQWLWDEIDRDSQRCRRSSVKQMEVVLTAYYRGDESSLDIDRINALAGRESSNEKKEIRRV